MSTKRYAQLRWSYYKGTAGIVRWVPGIHTILLHDAYIHYLYCYNILYYVPT